MAGFFYVLELGKGESHSSLGEVEIVATGAALQQAGLLNPLFSVFHFCQSFV
jgi:hypothetical protein